MVIGSLAAGVAHTAIERQAMKQQSQTQLLYSVEDAAAMLSLSRTTLYELMNKNQIKYIKSGRSTRFTPKQLEDFVSEAARRAEKHHEKRTFKVVSG